MNHFGSKTLTGIACTSFDSMINFVRFHIVVYFISKKDKDHQKDVIGCIYDDVITGLKNELSFFIPLTKKDLYPNLNQQLFHHPSSIHQLENLPLLKLRKKRTKRHYLLIKRKRIIMLKLIRKKTRFLEHLLTSLVMS